MKFSSLVLTSVFLSFNAFSASPVEIGEITYAGTGCVAGTADIRQHGNEIDAISFKDFKISARKSTQRLACDIVIPLQIPKGFQIAFAPIDSLEGFVSLPSKTSILTVKQEVFLAGSRGKVISTVKKGIRVEKLKIENPLILKDLRWSACGQSANLRVNISALLQNPTKNLAFVAIDSLNLLKSGRLYWRQCNIE